MNAKHRAAGSGIGASGWHTLSHAVNGCTCSAQLIDSCVICGATLRPPAERVHIDTCKAACYRQLVTKQRAAQLEGQLS